MPDWGAGAGGALTGAATGATVGSLIPGVGTAIGAGVGGLIGGLGGLFGGDDQAAKDEARRKQLLQQQAQQAGYFAGQSQDSYQKFGGQGQSALDALRAQAMGQRSVSAEQLRQSLGQLYAQQRSMAAGASPRNAAAAARLAAIRSSQLGAGLAGQQALAGLQEQNQAWQQYGGLLSTLRGQDLNAALGSRQSALQGYGAANAGTPAPSWIQQWGPAVTGALGAYTQLAGKQGGSPSPSPSPSAGGPPMPMTLNGAAFADANPMSPKPGFTVSDRRLKTEVRDGSKVADQALKGLGTHLYKYKDERHGQGDQLGQMAQDLERTPGLRHTVTDTPGGKAIDGAKLAAALAAIMPGLDKRLSKLEGKKAT